MAADTGPAEAALDALDRSVRAGAAERVTGPDEAVRRGRRGRHRRQGLGVAAAMVLLLAGFVAWRVVPSGGTGDSLQYGSEPANVEVFAVRSPRPLYWRLTALDEFNGIWRSQSQLEEVEPPGALPSGPVPGTEIAVGFEIGRLDRLWVPTAGHPVRLEHPSVPLSWNEQSMMLIATGHTALNDVTYTLHTVVPTVDAATLQAAPVGSPPDSPASDPIPLALQPDAVRAAVGSLALEGLGRYDVVTALQRYFRTGFTYSDRPSGNSLFPGEPGSVHGEASLLAERRGSQVEFAATFALMARILGVPSRVAVGYLPGDLGDDGRYHVTARHAHTWVEIWFEGTGWVGFDPSPRPGTTEQPF
jgi:hypothetical protein